MVLPFTSASPLSPPISHEEMDGGDTRELSPEAPTRFLIDILRQNPDMFVKERAGLEFPKTAEVITWLSGIQTVLPWTPRYKDVGVSSISCFSFIVVIFHQKDQVAVQHMAESADATRPECVVYPSCKCTPSCNVQCFPINDVVVALIYNSNVLEVDPLSPNILKSTSGTTQHKLRATEAHEAFMADLHWWTAKGYYVVVREWRPDFRVTWNKESVRIFKGSTEGMIDYQGM